MLELLDVLKLMPLPYIIFTVHSSSLFLGGNPYSASSDKVAQIWSTAATVLKRLQSWNDFQPATVAEVAHSLEAAYQNRTSG
jgi:hypothetical protein